MKYFEKLFIQQYNEIIINAPIQMIETAIIKDTFDNNVYLRNTFINVSNKIIIAIVIEGKLYDITGEMIDTELFKYTYQDYEIYPDEVFGNKIPIKLPDNVRKIELSIKKVVDTFGTVIDYSAFEVVPQEDIEKIDFPDEFLKSKAQNGFKPVIYPYISDKYWRCTCGRVNWNTDKSCLLCKRTIDEQSQITLESLKQEFQEYQISIEKKYWEEKRKDKKDKELEKEKKLQEELLELKIEETRKKRKRNQIIKVSLIVLAMIIVFILFLIYFGGMVE